MPAVCLYLQVHQPPRLRKFSIFDRGSDYFDDELNGDILRRVAQRSYLPTTELLLRQIDRHGGDFRVAIGLTGVAIDQCRRFRPEVLERFRELAHTGCVEFLAETYYHSLSFLYSRGDFHEQVQLHSDAIEELTGQTPVVFRNTELIYSNELARHLDHMDHFRGTLAEGVGKILAGRPVDRVYHPPGLDDLPVLLRDTGPSDDLAFRFADRARAGSPLTAAEFAESLLSVSPPEGDEPADAKHDPTRVRNVFLDFETFGEHQPQGSGIFELLSQLPAAVLRGGGVFLTPSECFDQFAPAGPYDVPQPTSWADTDRGVTAWLGNAMQASAANRLYQLEPKVRAAHDEQLLRDWRHLTASDHLYYMATKHGGDDEVHRYFSPYASPYDAYINYMNVLDHLADRLAEPVAAAAAG
jgi:alpha-amylase